MNIDRSRITILALAVLANAALLGLSLALPTSGAAADGRLSEAMLPAAGARPAASVPPLHEVVPVAEQRREPDAHLVGSFERMDPDTASRVLLLVLERDPGAAIEMLQSLTVDRTAEILERVARESPEAAADLSLAILRAP